MTTTSQSTPFSDDCGVPASWCTVTGQLQEPFNTVVLDLGPETAMVTAQILQMGSGTAFFEVSVDGAHWVAMPMRNAATPDAPAVSQTTVDGVWQAQVVGWRHFRVRAGDPYTGTFAQVTLLASGYGTPVNIGATAPLDPVNGTLWWSTELGQLFVWYDDGTSTQWVVAMPTVGPPGLPGDLAFNWTLHIPQTDPPIPALPGVAGRANRLVAFDGSSFPTVTTVTVQEVENGIVLPGYAVATAGSEVRLAGPLVTERAWLVREIIKTPGHTTMSARLQNLPDPLPASLVIRVDCGWNGSTFGAHPADNRDAASLGPGIPPGGGMAQPPWPVGPGHNEFWVELLGSQWVPNSRFFEGHCYEPGAPFDAAAPVNELLAWCRSKGQTECLLPPGMLYIQSAPVRVPEGCKLRGRGKRVTALFRADDIDQPPGLKTSHVIETAGGIDTSFRDVIGTEIEDLWVCGNRGHMVYRRGGPAVAVGGTEASEIDTIPSSFALRRLGIAGAGAYGYQFSGDGFKRDIVVEDLDLWGADSDGIDFKNRRQKNQRMSFSHCRHYHWSLGSQGTHLTPVISLAAGSIFTTAGSRKFGVARTALDTTLIGDAPHIGEVATFIDGGMVSGINLTDKHYLAVDYSTMGPNATSVMIFDAVEIEPTEVTISIANPGVVSSPGHTLADGRVVMFTTNGTLPLPLLPSTAYYVVNSAVGSYNVALTVGGAAIVTTGTQEGQHNAHGGYEATATASTTGPLFNVYMPHWQDGDVAFDLRGSGIRLDSCYAEARLVGHGGFRVRSDKTSLPGAIPPTNNVLNGCHLKDVSDHFVVPTVFPLNGSAFNIQGNDVQVINPIFEGTGFCTALQMTSGSRNLQVMSPKFSDCDYGMLLAGRGVNVTGGMMRDAKTQFIQVHGSSTAYLKDLPPDAFQALVLGSAQVRVNDPKHGLTTGAQLEFHLTNSTTNGLVIQGSNEPGSSTIIVVDENNYDITARRVGSQNCTITIANPAVVTWIDMPAGVANDDQILLSNTNLAVPAPLLPDVPYFIVNLAGSTLNLALTMGGAPISTVGAASGGVNTIIKIPPGGVGDLGAFDLLPFGGDDVNQLPGLGGAPTAIYPPDPNNIASDIHFNGLCTESTDPANTAVVFALGVNSVGGDFGQADNVSIQNCHDVGTQTRALTYATNLTLGPGNTGVPNLPFTDHPINWKVVEEIDLAGRYYYDFQNLDYPEIRLEGESITHSGTGTVTFQTAVSSDNCIIRRDSDGDSIRTGVNTTASAAIQFNIATGATAGTIIDFSNFNLKQRTWFMSVGGALDSGSSGSPALGGFYEARAKMTTKGGAGGQLLTLKMLQADGVTLVDLIGAPVAWITDNIVTSAAVRDAINALMGANGNYTAKALNGYLAIIARKPLLQDDVETVVATTSGNFSVVGRPNLLLEEAAFNALRVNVSSPFTSGKVRVMRRG